MKKTMALTMAGLMVLVAISISANAAVQQQKVLSTQGSSNGGSLSGKIIDKNSNPIEGANITLAGGFINLEDFEFAITLDRENSAADGSYRFDVSSGQYTMLVTKEGYLFGLRYTIVNPGESVIENFHLISIRCVPVQKQRQSLNRAVNNPFLSFLEQYPILYQLLQRVLKL